MRSLIILLLLSSLLFAENYAILITGDTPDEQGTSAKTWPGVATYVGDPSYPEFWNDTFLMWETLYNLGFSNDNIFVCYGSGVDYPSDVEEYQASSYGLTNLTDFSARLLGIDSVLSGLSYGDYGLPQLTSNDFLFVWTFGHGSTTGTNNSRLHVMDGTITDSYFAGYLDYISYDKRVILMQQCYAGGFIDDLDNVKSIILTASQGDEEAYGADDVKPDGNDNVENEIISDVTYTHGEFNYHAFNAINLETIAGNGGVSDSVDTNDDGKASLEEIFDWVDLKESSKTQHSVGTPPLPWGPENPQFDDDGNIAGSTYVDVAPAQPANLSGSWSSNHPYLSWSENSELDLQYYEIWKKRGPTGSWTLKTTTTNTYYTDVSEIQFSSPPKINVYYKIRSVDNVDNVSTFSGSLSFLVNDWQQSENLYTNIQNIKINEFSLYSNFPNPFNPETKISFGLPEKSIVNLDVYDVSGKKVVNLISGNQEEGMYTMTFSGQHLPSGVYIYKMNAKGIESGKIFTDVKRMLLIK